MRYTSSGRRAVAAVLCVLLAAFSGRPPVLAGEPPSPSLLLAFHAIDVPTATARARMEAISARLLSELRVSWLPIPPQAGSSGRRADLPEADGAALERISSSLGDAARRMERMETREAEALLDAAERDARSFRPGESLRPYLAEIFLRRGLLLLWAGSRTAAEEMFGRVRVLRPDFAPDPALFSPSFREAWSRAAARPPAGAEILVQSIPPGADIVVGGARAGATPGRIRVPVLSPVVIQVSRPGYLPVELSGHWLPGDSEMRDVTLTRDRLSRLEELVAAADGGREAGAILDEMARAAGAERVAVIVMSGRESASGVRVLSFKQGDDSPAAVGAFAWQEGEDGAGAAAARSAALLKSAGWPALSGKPRATSWYHKWWLWALTALAVVGVAVGSGGGGGGSGSGTGTVAINF